MLKIQKSWINSFKKNSLQDLTHRSHSNSHTASLLSDCLVKINHYQQQKQHRWQKRGLNWLLLSCRQSLGGARGTQRFLLPGIPWVETVRYEISLISRVGLGHSKQIRTLPPGGWYIISTHGPRAESKCYLCDWSDKIKCWCELRYYQHPDCCNETPLCAALFFASHFHLIFFCSNPTIGRIIV